MYGSGITTSDTTVANVTTGINTFDFVTPTYDFVAPTYEYVIATPCSICGRGDVHAAIISSQFNLCDSCRRKLKILLDEIID